jgi:hypothetical protein
MIPIAVDQALEVPAGEFEFEFNCTSKNTQYAFDTNLGDIPSAQIAAWGANGKGLAVNKKGTWYLHVTLPVGKIRFTVYADANQTPVGRTYKVKLRKRSWWEKVFG